MYEEKVTEYREQPGMFVMTAPSKIGRLFSPSGLSPNKVPNFLNKPYRGDRVLEDLYGNRQVDLNNFLLDDPDRTFLIRVTGKSMINAGINSGDLLIVDKSISAENGKIVVASINNELLVKRLVIKGSNQILKSENADYPDFEVKDTDKFEIWGVVTQVIKAM